MSDEPQDAREDAAPPPAPEPPPPTPEPRRWRPAEEPTCCGSGCIDCPF